MRGDPRTVTPDAVSDCIEPKALGRPNISDIQSDRRDPSKSTRRSSARRGGRRASDLPPEWLSVSDYAHCYGVDRDTVHKWLQADLLESFRVGKLIRIRHTPPRDSCSG
jgi:hypothetical protein